MGLDIGDYRWKDIIADDEYTSYEWRIKVANKGSVHAMMWLGDRFRKGEGDFPKDSAKAIEFYTMAVETGKSNGFTMEHLGDCFASMGDDIKAFEWYTKAATDESQIQHSAMERIADCYHLGKGVAKDEEKAKEWRDKCKKVRERRYKRGKK